jgi:hypothetical protein
MRSALPSFLVLHGLNAIATAIIRRAFAGAMLAQSHFRRSPARHLKSIARLQMAHSGKTT